jgi:hypothetical protein
VESTFYRTPSVATVNGWGRKTPEGFVLAAKVPQIITRQNVLQDSDEDLEHFLETTDLMGDKLGPLLFQFGYFNQTVFRSSGDFLARLKPFLAKVPKGYKFAVGGSQVIAQFTFRIILSVALATGGMQHLLAPYCRNWSIPSTECVWLYIPAQFYLQCSWRRLCETIRFA